MVHPLMFNPICETFTAFPMDIDIKKLEAEFKPPEAAKRVEAEKGPRDFLQVPYESWPVLPIFKLQLEHLKPIFSYRYNKYMRCKYRKFLNNVPETFVTVLPRNVNLCRQPKPRRKTLNGEFYSKDFKLAPVPINTGYR